MGYFHHVESVERRCTWRPVRRYILIGVLLAAFTYAVTGLIITQLASNTKLQRKKMMYTKTFERNKTMNTKKLEQNKRMNTKKLGPNTIMNTKKLERNKITNNKTPQAIKSIVILDWSGNSWRPFREHEVDNCLVTRNKSLLLQSQAVVISHRLQGRNISSYPQTRRNEQRWVWLMDESPHRVNIGVAFKSIRNIFNWTMTYRTTSEVYIPYGWTTRLKTSASIPDFSSNRTKLAVSVMTNCGAINKRSEYIKQLKQFMPVEMFGWCGGKMCGEAVNHHVSTCKYVKEYLFFLAFENSNCKEYISEKPFEHGFDMGTVPVVMGAPKEDYAAICPPNSFIHVNDFSGPAELAKYLTFLWNNRAEYMKYHEWRRNYRPSYRLQYELTEPMWKSLCQALNNDNGKPKMYDDIGAFWTSKECQKPP